MSYTLSFDASVKCHSIGDVKGLLHHNGRDVDADNGIEVVHANLDIRPEDTDKNETWTIGQDGKQVLADSVDQVMDALKHRLDDVVGRKVKNPVVLRPLVLQLDPEWYKGKTQAEKDAAADDMLAWAEKTFDKRNLIYVCRHVDEGENGKEAEHLHIGFCPVTKDGRLSQKEWFSTPQKLREMHDDFRRHMIDAGYDVSLSRKKPGKYAKRMSESEYKDYAELQKQAQELRRTQDALSQRAAGLMAQERALEARERALAQVEADYAAQRQTALEGLSKARKEQLAYTAKVAAWAEQHGYGKPAQQMRHGSAARDERAVAAQRAARPGRSMADIDAAASQLTRGSHDNGLSL